MIYTAYVIRLLFTVYSIMLATNVFGSWFPQFQRSRFMYFIKHYTEPYLNVFRRFIPPIGGVLDLSPLIGFFVLQLIQKLIFFLLFQ